MQIQLTKSDKVYFLKGGLFSIQEIDYLQGYIILIKSDGMKLFSLEDLTKRIKSLKAIIIN